LQIFRARCVVNLHRYGCQARSGACACKFSLILIKVPFPAYSTAFACLLIRFYMISAVNLIMLQVPVVIPVKYGSACGKSNGKVILPSR
jgi:hypothetical protein